MCRGKLSFVGAFVPWMGPIAPSTDVRVLAIVPPAHVHLVVPANWSLVSLCSIVIPPFLLRMTHPVLVAIVGPFLAPFLALPGIVLGCLGALFGAAGC
jgi:hypothetical protein